MIIFQRPFSALTYGLWLGYYCCCCCLNLMIILLVAGVMDLRAMFVITVAMAVEPLFPNNKLIVYGIGLGAFIVGLVFFIKEAGLK